MKIKPVIWLTTIVGIIGCVAAYWMPPFFQGLLVEVGVTLLAFAMGLSFINVYLNTAEKKRAAIPLLQMIAPALSKLHNDFVIEKGRIEFGTPNFNALLDTYQENNRDPKALSPQQRDGLYNIVKTNRTDILNLIGELHDQLKEMSFILGWSFSPVVIRASLDCRLNIVKLQNLNFDDTTQAKLDACELFLDIDAQANAVLDDLKGLLGKKNN